MLIILYVLFYYHYRFWNWDRPHAEEIHDSHKEFVYGVDFHPLKTFEVSFFFYPSE